MKLSTATLLYPALYCPTIFGGKQLAPPWYESSSYTRQSTIMAEPQRKGVVNVGTRKSPLALAQTQIVVDALKKNFPDHEFNIHSMTTTGDRDQNTALYNFGGKGLWTSQLEEKLVNKELDIVVHSLKDMPTVLPEGCVLGCVTSREDPRDTLVIKKELQDKHGWKTLADLPDGSIIGTSSVRRIAQLIRRYPTLKFKDHRGNIQTRLRKLEEDPDLTGIILAAAGLQRMDLGDHITQFLESDNGGILHAVGQGALGVECRADDEEVIRLLKTIENEQTALACEAERALMRALEGGCSVPIGVETKWVDDKLHMKATVVNLRGDHGVDSDITEPVKTREEADKFGRKLANALVERGGGSILDEITRLRQVPETVK
ncbi:porphobilinogen deaminase [Fusarium mundagurra]|uniref:Porphobilinogen deaminase n=1 Tax=Fusarium mundagurra TaxID=1567541 RepID=A0A8H6D998_9HYPO|nr:porphobilinogen deaminase [Fusarium mundagurra]